MKTLLIDGQFNLKRSHFKGGSIESDDHHFCGGLIYFLVSLHGVLNKVLPDRVVVAWDGFNPGKLRYEIYKPYKASKNKKWSEEVEMFENEGVTNNEEEKDNFEILRQKIELRQILEELFVRQIEVDNIESIDLVAGYVKNSKEKDLDEEIVIFGSNKDYNQLISNQVSVINDHGLLTIKNFKEKNDYIIDNELLIRCFEGNKSDGIDGVNGINKKTILKFFPEVSNVKHTYQNLSDRSTKLIEDEKKTQKVYKKIIDARNILYRNVVLMNLKKPFLNEESLNEISDISSLSLDKDRNIDGIIDLFNKSGYTKHLGDHEINIDSFFSSFHRLKNKELEYSNKIFNT